MIYNRDVWLVTLLTCGRLPGDQQVAAGMLTLSGPVCYRVYRPVLGLVSLCWWQQQRPAWRQGVGSGLHWLTLVVHQERLCRLRPEGLG